MSRPSSPRVPNETSSTMMQSGRSRIPTDELYDLPYLRSDGQPPPSKSVHSSPSSPTSRSAPFHNEVPTRASILGSPVDRPQPRYEPLRRGSQSTSSHTNPTAFMGENMTPPNPSWLKDSASHSASSSDEGGPAGSRSPNPSSSASGHTTSSSALPSQPCAGCSQPMSGQFVRALGTVYHLECFRCRDCNEPVASKFFPIEGQDSRQHPLCERDYFRRLDLLCAKCDQALRGSYITACNRKYHVEHFTCSVCPTLFGPQDSYYEHENDVYCHFHYSTRFATKCIGCNSAILKQFVEINRNSRDECWHPECYMINKFWNIKVASRVQSTEIPEGELSYEAEERQETPTSLREKQQRMEHKVVGIWTYLSSFEESSAACISDMLKHVSSGHYLEAIKMAEMFILHVEVLFAAIDDLEVHFARVNSKGISHVREARMLCRKTVELFNLLSHTGEAGTTWRVGMTQDLLSLVTGLAHYLKILIRIALTGALKLDRDYDKREALMDFLDKLKSLAAQGANPSARRTLRASRPREVDIGNPHTFVSGTEGVSYGYKSLAPENAGDSPFIGRTSGPNGSNGSMSIQPSDLCLVCQKTVEEDCVRLGSYHRWHSHCVKCVTCGRAAGEPAPVKESKTLTQKNGEQSEVKSVQPSRRPPAKVNEFLFVPDASGNNELEKRPPKAICCVNHPLPGSQAGFLAVSRLEQFAFLLNVALRRLYLLLLRRGLIPPASTVDGIESPHQRSPSRDSSDIMRMKTVHLDRKLSATARLPKRSTIIESPSGRIAQPADARPHGIPTGPSQPHQPVTPQLRDKKPPRPPAVDTNAASISPAAYSSTLTLSPKTVIRPPFARNNTGVAIVEDMRPEGERSDSEASHGARTLTNGYLGPPGRTDVDQSEEGITLGDIPQILESEQAREQHRSLPRQADRLAIAELTPLELFIVKHFVVLMLQRSSLKDQFDLDEILELVETKKSTFWNKIFKGDKKNIKKKGVFGVPIELLVEREGVDSLLGASNGPLRIPSFIDDVISAMKQMDVSIEGIFRKNGNIRRLKDLTDAIDRDPASVDLASDNPVQLAALLKKFLRDLPDPLLTFRLHRLFIQSQSFSSEEDRTRYLHLVSLLLPKSHRDTLEALFVFLKWVSLFSHVDEETGSKMDLQNLATVICPNILYAKGRDVAREESFMAIRVVTILLEQQDEFFTVPDEFLSILHDQEYFASCMDMPPKDVLRKCETYLRLKQGRLNGAERGYNGTNGHPQSGNGGDNGGGIHQKRSDSMMRGRPTPPYAGDQNGEKARRSPRSASRGPPSSQSHSAQGNASSPNLHESKPWMPSSPPSRSGTMLRTSQMEPAPTWADRPKPGSPSRPSSFQARGSMDIPHGPGSYDRHRAHSPADHQ